VVAKHPDLTLLETIAELRKQRIRTSRSSLWRFLDRHNITLKKSLQAAERQRADVARARFFLIPPVWCSSMKLRSAQTWRG
jgi:hypothetical protein